jgi:uncharacterized membrane protein YecN with MAPEG domain
MATVTASFALLVILMLTLLAMNTTRLRFTTARSTDPADKEATRRASRAHGNMLEHGLPVLLLMFFSESHGANLSVLCVLGSAFILARVIYTYGIIKKPASPPMQLGASITYLVELSLLVLLFSRLV